jgi:hypothetical protein
VPGLSLNLLLIASIAKYGRSVVFDDSDCKIVDKHIDVSSKDIFGTATQVNGMYRLDRKEHTAFCCAYCKSKYLAS